MTEPLLNQDEISDLLKDPQAATGPVGRLWEGESASYDLLQSGATNETQLQRVGEIATTIGTQWIAAVNTMLSVTLQAVAAPTTLLPITDIMAEVAVEKILCMPWRSPMFDSPGVLLLDRRALFALYTTLLGGGAPVERVAVLTLLEKNFLERLLQPLEQAMVNAWQSLMALSPTRDALIAEQSEIQKLGWNFDAIRTTYAMMRGETELGQLHVVYPRDLLTALAEKAVVVGDTTTTAEAIVDQRWREAVAPALFEVELHKPITVELGSVTASMGTMLKIAPGAELPLALPANGHTVFVGADARFLAKIGSQEGMRAAQIIEFVGGPYG